MKNQEILLKSIRQKIGDNSLIEKISIILGISYDAAHRRTSGKSKFSIDETIQLCNTFQISMDQLFLNANQYILEKTDTIKNTSDFKAYLKKTTELLHSYTETNSTAYYSAKDIPLHYTIGGTLLSKFKLFVWLTILNSETNTSFENFKIDISLLEETSTLIHIFNQVKRIEIWNDTTINSSLQQLMYFYESGLISYNNTCEVLVDITNCIQKVESNTLNNHNFELFYNELLLLNNTVLFTNSQQAHFFIPHNMLSYYVSIDKKTCLEEQAYINQQIKNSKSLTNSGIKEQKNFFNRMYQKIDFYQKKIDNYILE